jgi:hypothetical protein
MGAAVNVGDVFVHYSGKTYELISDALAEAGGARLVVYRCRETGAVYVCPRDEFYGFVEVGDRVGLTAKRFTPLAEWEAAREAAKEAEAAREAKEASLAAAEKIRAAGAALTESQAAPTEVPESSVDASGARSDAYLDLAAIELGEALALYGNLRRRGARAGDARYNVVALKLGAVGSALRGVLHGHGVTGTS